MRQASSQSVACLFPIKVVRSLVFSLEFVLSKHMRNTFTFDFLKKFHSRVSIYSLHRLHIFDFVIGTHKIRIMNQLLLLDETLRNSWFSVKIINFISNLLD